MIVWGLVWRYVLVCACVNCLFAALLCYGLSVGWFARFVCLFSCDLCTLRRGVFDLRLCCWCDVRFVVVMGWLVCGVGLWVVLCSWFLCASVALLPLNLCGGSFILLMLGFWVCAVDFGFVGVLRGVLVFAVKGTN